MSEYNALSPNPENPSLLMLEASAGTGKTFAIEHIVMRLMVHDSLQLHQIVVVTFTNLAAAELRKRLSETLQALALELMQTNTSRLDGFPYIVVNSSDDRKRLLRRVYGCINEIDNLRVSTIHGFCFRLLQESIFKTGGILKNQSEKYEGMSLWDLAHHHYAYTDNSIPPFAKSCLQQHFRGDIRALLKELVKATLAMTAGPKYCDDYQNQIKRLAESLQSIPVESQEQFESLLQEIGKNYKGLLAAKSGDVHSHYKLQITHLMQLQSERDDDFHQLLSYKDHLFKCLKPSNQKVKQHSLSSKANSLLIHLQTISEYFDDLQDPGSILLVLAETFKPVLETFLSENLSAHPDQLLIKVHDIVTSGSREVVTELMGDTRALVVDEFQDTDAVQWSLFKTMYTLMSQEEPLFYFIVVGDPKQSIYRFRGADLDVYLKAKDFFNKNGEVKHLLTNYRSSHELISVLNTFLSSCNSILTLFKDAKNLNYVTVQAAQSPQKLSPCFYAYYDKVDGSKAITKVPEEKEKQMLLHIAFSIEQHLADGVNLGDIVVMVSDRYQAARAKAFFTSLNYPTLSSRSTPLTESSIFHWFFDYFDAIRNLKNLHRFELHELTKFLFDSQSELITFLIESQSAFESGGLSQALFLLKKHFLKPIQSYLFSQQSEDLKEDWDQMMELLLKHFTGKKSAVWVVVEWLRNLAGFIKDDEIIIERAKKDTRCLKIMTMHASKGLEFDIVFLIGVSQRSRFKPLWLKTNQQGLISSHKGIKEKEKAALELADEKLRLLYVAMTRAKRSLYLYAFELPSSPQVATASPIEVYLALYLMEAKKMGYTEALKESFETAFSQLIKSLRLPYLVHFDKLPACEKDPKVFAVQKPDIQLEYKEICTEFSRSPSISFSSLQNKLKLNESVPSLHVKQDVVSDPHPYPRGAEVGIIIHAILEEIFAKGLHRSKKYIDAVVEKHSALTCLETVKDETKHYIQNILSFPLFGGRSLAQLSNTDFFPEVEFSYSDNQALFKGYIDLCVRIDNMYYIVDWKTNDLGLQAADYGYDNLKNAIVENRYDIQASFYAEALRRYLCLDDDSFDKVFAGAIYVFVRGTPHGKGVYAFRPQIETLSQFIDRGKNEEVLR